MYNSFYFCLTFSFLDLFSFSYSFKVYSGIRISFELFTFTVILSLTIFFTCISTPCITHEFMLSTSQILSLFGASTFYTASLHVFFLLCPIPSSFLPFSFFWSAPRIQAFLSLSVPGSKDITLFHAPIASTSDSGSAPLVFISTYLILSSSSQQSPYSLSIIDTNYADYTRNILLN